jgi:predicted DNA-binding transcriptional regulator AlpA
MKTMPVSESQRLLTAEPLLVDVATAAQMLAISQRKLWSLTNIGDVPCVRIGKSVRYSLEELRAWTRSKMIQSAIQE